MIRAPQNVDRARYAAPEEGMGAGTVVGMILVALLLAAGGPLNAQTPTTNPPTGQASPKPLNPPPAATTGQADSSQTTHAPVPTTAPIAPSTTPTASSIDTNKGVDVEESPTMKK